MSTLSYLIRVHVARKWVNVTRATQSNIGSPGVKPPFRRPTSSECSLSMLCNDMLCDQCQESSASHRNKFLHLVIPRTKPVIRNSSGLTGVPIKTIGSYRRWCVGDLPLRKGRRCVHQYLAALPPYSVRLCRIGKCFLCEFGKYTWVVASLFH